MNVLVFYFSVYVVTLFIWQIKTVLLNASSCALCAMRPNKPKHRILEQRKIFAGSCRENGWLVPKKNPKLSEGFQQSIFKEKVRKYA